MNNNTLKIENLEDAEAYANLMRELHNNPKEIDQEQEAMFEECAEILDFYEQIMSKKK